MTPQWYNEHGYKVSQYIEQSEIDRAEADVRRAYVEPIVGNAEVSGDVVEGTVGCLAHLLLLQRTIFATRAGAKVKTGYNSQETDAWNKLQQEATSCHLALINLRNQVGVNSNAEVVDICKIYFRTNFFNL